MPRVRK